MSRGWPTRAASADCVDHDPICHFISSKYDLTKITFAISESDFDEETILWIVPVGAKFPKYADKEYKIIQAENLEQEFDYLFIR